MTKQVGDAPRPTPRTTKAKVPQVFKVRDNIPPGHELRLGPDAMRALVSLFGEKALQAVGVPAAPAAGAKGAKGAGGDADPG